MQGMLLVGLLLAPSDFDTAKLQGGSAAIATR